MDSHKPPFDWVQFPEGRARFSGGVRGIDEQGHDTIAVEVDGNEYFGEIEPAFLPNNNDYNVEIVSFGYGAKTSFGMPMLAACHVFSAAEINTVQRLIVQLVAAGMKFTDRPNVLMEFPNAHFMGEVLFRDGWALVKEDEATS